MNRMMKMIVAAAVPATMTGSALAAGVTVYGGATYDTDPNSLTGYTSASMQLSGFNVGNGVAVAGATKYEGGSYRGSVATRFTTGGATVLDGYSGTSSSGSTSNGVLSVNATGTAVGYAEKYSSAHVDLGPRAVR